MLASKAGFGSMCRHAARSKSVLRCSKQPIVLATSSSLSSSSSIASRFESRLGHRQFHGTAVVQQLASGQDGNGDGGGGILTETDLRKIKKLLQMVVLNEKPQLTPVQASELQKQLQSYRDELARLQETKNKLDALANRYASRMIWIGLGYLSVQAGILARLTWWDFSWDVIEPVTYFVTFSSVLFAYVWFAKTNSEYTYEGLRHSIAVRRVKVLYKKHNFDEARFEELRKLIYKCEEQLGMHDVPKIYID